MDRGEVVRAVFQEATDYGCAVRIALGGGDPVLPLPSMPREPDPDFWPDEEWPE